MNHLTQVLSIFEGAERPRAFLLLLAIVVGAVLEMVGIGLVMPFIALLTDPSLVERNQVLAWLQELSGADTERSFLLLCGALLLAYYLLKNVLLGVLTYAQYRFVYGKARAIAGELLRAYLTAPYSLHLRRNSAELQRNINTDVPLMSQWVVAQTFLLVSDVLILTIVAGLLLWVQPVATLAAAVVLGGVGYAYLRIARRRTGELGREQQDQFGRMVQWVNQGTGGIKEARVLGTEEFFAGRFEDACRRYERARRLIETMNDMPRLFFETVAVGGVLTVASVTLLRDGTPAEVLPTLAVFAAASFRMIPAVTRVVRSVNLIRQYRPSFDVVMDDLRALREHAADVGVGRDVGPRGLREGIEFRDVRFRYEGTDQDVLAGLSLRVPAAGCVAFVGTSGAGKTTAVDLLLGLFRPTAGQVLVDGQDLWDDVAAWRATCGYIPQSIYLTDDTIRRNVAYGLRDEAIDDDAVWRALESARLAEFVRSLPRGLDEPVGEGGVRISGGQRQRIGIARALYRDPEVLVMDEATSALDPETEDGIIETTLELGRRKTVILVAHRLRTVERCDRVFFLADGKVEAEGTYDELLERSAAFRRMAREAPVGSSSTRGGSE